MQCSVCKQSVTWKIKYINGKCHLICVCGRPYRYYNTPRMAKAVKRGSVSPDALIIGGIFIAWLVISIISAVSS